MAGIMSELTNFASDGKGRKRRGGRPGGRRRRRNAALWNTLIFGGILLLAGGGMWLVEQRRAADRARQQAARAAGAVPKEQVDPLKSDPNWLIAKWVVETGGWVTVEIDGGRKVVKQSRFIPKKPFQILEIDLESINWSTAEPLSLLPDLPALTVIEANGSAFSDVDMKQLAGAARLTTLKLARTRVTSFGLAPLAKLPQLVNLDLERTSISDDGVDALAKCKRLTTLVVRGTSLTEQGIAALKSALPDCRIVTE